MRRYKRPSGFAVEIETAPQTKSIKGIRAPKSDAQDYIKEAYKSFRKVLAGSGK